MGRDIRPGASKVRRAATEAGAGEYQWLKDSVVKKETLVLGRVQRQIKQRIEENNEARDTEHLHASEISKNNWCPRSTWYRIKGVEPDKQTRHSLQTIQVFEEGHSIHDKFQGALWRDGSLMGHWRCLVCEHYWEDKAPRLCASCSSPFIKYAEVPIEDPSIHLIGHGDGLVDVGRPLPVLIEIKTIGLGTFRMEVPGLYNQYQRSELTLPQLWSAVRRPFPSHLRQGMLYLRAKKLKTAVFLYEFKANQAQKEFVVPYNPSIIADVVAGAEAVKRALEEGTTVKRPQWAEDEEHKVCRKCDYRRTCWGISASAEEATGRDRVGPAGERPIRILRRSGSVQGARADDATTPAVRRGRSLTAAGSR